MKAPFTPEQVKELNEHQENGNYHPYICCGLDIPECKRSEAYKQRRQGQNIPYTKEKEGVLTATENGWICPCVKYKQNWAH